MLFMLFAYLSIMNTISAHTQIMKQSEKIQVLLGLGI